MNFYQYIFYQLYKLTEDWGFWPEGRVFSFMIILDVALLGSLVNFYTILTNEFVHLPSNQIYMFIMVSIIVIINYCLLLKGNKKEEIISVFDKMPLKKNIIGGIIVFVGVILLIVIFITSLFYVTKIR
jgi:hypothetical protein